MNLNDAKQLGRQLMNQHGMKNIPLVISGGKRTLGVCVWKAGPSLPRHAADLNAQIFGIRKSKRERFANAPCKEIRLSKYLIALNDENEIRDTMLHEIAHFLVGANHGHDRVWRQQAIKIGCNGERTAKTAEMPKGRYKAECQCGKVYFKHRKGKNVLKANWFRCGVCNKSIQFYDTMATV